MFLGRVLHDVVESLYFYVGHQPATAGGRKAPPSVQAMDMTFQDEMTTHLGSVSLELGDAHILPERPCSRFIMTYEHVYVGHVSTTGGRKTSPVLSDVGWRHEKCLEPGGRMFFTNERRVSS